MNYIETLKNNYNNYKKIRKIAQEKGIKYEIAKIMYHDGKMDITEEEANEIYNRMKFLKIPISMIDKIELIDQYRDYQNIYITEVCKSIAKYANKPLIEELSTYIFAEEQYGYEILNIAHNKKIPIDLAIKIFDLKIKKEMQDNNLTEIGALAKLLYFKNNIAAREFEKAYKKGEAYENEPYITIMAQISDSNEYKKKTIHNIRIMSKTEEGLKELEKIIEEVYAEGNKDFLNKLERQAKLLRLTITDFSLTDEKKPHYSPSLRYIYLDERKTSEEQIAMFYHEINHFLDNASAREYDRAGEMYDNYSFLNPEIKKILEIIKGKVVALERGVDIKKHNEKNANEYVNNPIIERKWLNEIKKKNPNAGEEDIKLFLEQKKLYEKKRYKELSRIISDILDALAEGKVFQKGGSGHGVKYYSDVERQLMEFIANIGALYNLNATDLLYYEFGEEIGSELVRIYETFIHSERFEEERIKIGIASVIK